MRPTAQLIYYNQVNPALAGLTFRGVELKEPEDAIEWSGRWDYGEKNAQKLGQKSKYRVIKGVDLKSVDVGSDGGAHVNGVVTEYEEREMPIIQKYIAMGHESMLEMGDATFFIECSRVVSHELVRHRLASFQQESQRFTKYDDETPEDLFYVPDEIIGSSMEDEYRQLMADTLTDYLNLKGIGQSSQIARYVFPNATRTRLIMKANVREWRHICGLRLDKSVQPEMRLLMRQIYDQLVEIYPNAMYGVLDGERKVR